MRHLRYFDAAGTPLCETDLEALWENVGPCIGIERRMLLKILRERASGIPIRYGLSAAGFTHNNDWVRVQFSDGSCADYDLVIGADGIHSTVRAVAHGGPSPRYAGQVVWRSVIDGTLHGLNGMHQVMGNGCFFGLLPVAGGRTYGFAGVDAPRPLEDPLEGRLVRLRAQFAALGGPVPEYLAGLQCDAELRYDTIEWLDCDQWAAGRVLVIGDAAHASPPHMGQGGCLAIEDGVVLAEVLRSAETLDDALQTFVERRRPRIEWVQEQSRAALRFWLQPPNKRDAALREQGDEAMRTRYTPLLAAP